MPVGLTGGFRGQNDILGSLHDDEDVRQLGAEAGACVEDLPLAVEGEK